MTDRCSATAPGPIAAHCHLAADHSGWHEADGERDRYGDQSFITWSMTPNETTDHLIRSLGGDPAVDTLHIDEIEGDTPCQ
jgi:hypothetical protein